MLFKYQKKLPQSAVALFAVGPRGGARSGFEHWALSVDAAQIASELLCQFGFYFGVLCREVVLFADVLFYVV